MGTGFYEIGTSFSRFLIDFSVGSDLCVLFIDSTDHSCCLVVSQGQGLASLPKGAVPGQPVG